MREGAPLRKKYCGYLTPSLRPGTDGRPKQVFYSSTAYRTLPSIHLFKIPRTRFLLYKQQNATFFVSESSTL